MTETAYVVEFAKSARSKCKKCKETIEKGEIRIQSTSHDEEKGMHYSSSYHPSCFTKPRKCPDLDDFMENVLIDGTGGEILPEKAEELKEQINARAPKKKATDDDNPLKEIKELFEASQGGEENPKKKQKVEEVEVYAQYHKMKVDDLKDMLRWNRQVLKGTKNVVLFKVIDGTVHGRLARCGMDGGKLKLTDDCKGVVCDGRFDEDTKTRLPCSFTCSLEDAPRWKWFDHKPTEEENAEMDKQVAEAQGETVGGSDETNAALKALQKDAAKLDWDLSSRGAIRASCEAMTELLEKHGFDKPTTKKVGAIISANRDRSQEEIAELCAKEFGNAKEKAKKAAKKEENVKNAIKCEANSALVSAFRELADLYIKQQNRNAAATYFKVVNALSDLDFEVTEHNALGLGKGKTKVHNIGKSSAEKIHEFVTTGTMQKLEEKRADVEE